MSKNKTANLVLTNLKCYFNISSWTSFIYIFPQDIEKENKFSLLCTLMLFNVIDKWRAFWKLNSLHGCNKLLDQFAVHIKILCCLLLYNTKIKIPCLTKATCGTRSGSTTWATKTVSPSLPGWQGVTGM